MNILLVQDSGFSADLIRRSLRNCGFEFDMHRVYDESGMRAALGSSASQPDIILCEDVLLRFDCLSALAVVRELCPIVPLIFISGGQGEELAIECVKSGAHDFVLMSNIVRLPRAIERAVREARESAQAARVLREKESRNQFLARLVEQAGESVVSTDLDGVVRSWNQAAETLYGFSAEEALGKSLRSLQLAHIGDEEYRTVVSRIRSAKACTVESSRRCKDGTMRHVVSNHSPLFDDAGTHIGQVGIGREIARQARNGDRVLQVSGV
ncbi:MAG: PAS domain S-box protein [Betaproteobacteria bacterium]|nr:PAS domain S-box protein [Betaproteobacteria bacterium]